MLWVDLWLKFVDAHHDPIDEDTIRGTFEFAWWSVTDSGDPDATTAAICHFFEDLPTDPRVRELLPQFMTCEQFLGMRELFRYHLSSDEHRQFVDDFVARRAQIERATKAD